MLIFMVVYVCTDLLVKWLQCSPMDLETGIQSPGRVIPKVKKKKMVLVFSLLNPQHKKVRIEDKWINPGKRVAPSPTPCWN